LDADRKYLSSIVEPLLEDKKRVLLKDLRSEIQDTIDPKRKQQSGRKSTNYEDIYPELAPFFLHFEESIKHALHPDDQKVILSDIFRAMVAPAAGPGKSLCIYAWFHHCHPEAAKKVLDRLRDQLSPDHPIPEYRPLLEPPHIYKSWDEYAQAEISETYRRYIAEKQAKTDSGLGLVRPRPDRDLNPGSALQIRYFAGGTRFVGREAERGKLASFLRTPSTCAWWQISGPAGQGKSRLALNLVDECLTNEWDAGFVEELDDAFLRKIETAHIHRPTLIIVDDLSNPDRAKRLGSLISMLSELSERRNPGGNAVRLLVLDRQPYDSLFNTELRRHPEEWASPWQNVYFIDQAARRPSFLATVYDRKHALHLGPLADSELIKIAESWCETQHGRKRLETGEIAALKRFLDLQSSPSSAPKNDEDQSKLRERLRRPLFAILAIDAVLNGRFAPETDSGISVDTVLLDFALDSDAHQMAVSEELRARPIQGMSIALGDHQHQNLAILTNMLGHITFRPSAEGFPVPLPSRYADIELVHRMLGYPVFVGPDEEEQTLFARQPDLLAEYQVLKLITLMARPDEEGKADDEAGEQRVQSLLDFAWNERPVATAGFLYRLIQDFTSHRALNLIILSHRPNSKSFDPYAYVLMHFITSCISSWPVKALARLDFMASHSKSQHVHHCFVSSLSAAYGYQFDAKDGNKELGESIFNKISRKNLELATDFSRALYVNAASTAAISYCAARDSSKAMKHLGHAKKAYEMVAKSQLDEHFYTRISGEITLAIDSVSAQLANEGKLKKAIRLFGEAEAFAETGQQENTNLERHAIAALEIASEFAARRKHSEAQKYLAAADKLITGAMIEARLCRSLTASVVIRIVAAKQSVAEAHDMWLELSDGVETLEKEILALDETDKNGEKFRSGLPNQHLALAITSLELAGRLTQKGELDAAFKAYNHAARIANDQNSQNLNRMAAQTLEALVLILASMGASYSGREYIRFYLTELFNLGLQTQDPKIVAQELALRKKLGLV
jgi:hypothetical protein